MRSLHFLTIPIVCFFTAGYVSAIEPLAVESGDKIVIIGNTLAERMQQGGDFEALVQSRFPGKQLVVRNLGWSADEIDLRPRSANFKDHGHSLSDHRPDIVLAMFGFNESFAGPSKLAEFATRFEKFLAETQQQASGAELVIFSPIPHENLERPELPDGEATNKNLILYSEAMKQKCAEAGVRFIDLYAPMREAMQAEAKPLTINGVHLNQRGNELLAAAIDRALFGPRPATTQADMKALREAVVEKDRQFYYDYRAVNGYYIYGGRKNPYGVVNFPEEFAKLRKMIELRDQRVWAIAMGQTVSDSIDDSSTGELSPIESNVAADPVYHSAEESQKLFDIQDGYEIEIFASEADFPELMNPVALDIDARGRVWVTTTPCYPQYLPGTPVNDKVLILEDSDGDGKADKRTVFADGLHLPIGIALLDGGAYVSQQPNLMFLQDTDGDDMADKRELVLHGFDSADSHHSISAFTVGPDGALYMQEGTFHHSQIETPYGPQRVKDAAVFRYEPKTEKLSIFVSYSFANPWGHCFDYWGQNFIADASPGANYFAAAFSGDVIYPQKHRQMQQFLKKQWRPTAACQIVSNSHFPDEAQGNYLINNTIGFLGTLQYKMQEDGSGFKADPVDPLLSSRDTNFRPIDQKFAPDGSLYIVDWFNPLIGHMQHNLRDPKRDKHHGRIWRVRNKNKPLLEVPAVETASIAELVVLLERKDDMIRDLARRQLRLHPAADVVKAIDTWLAKQQGDDTQTEHNRLEALWVMQQLDQVRPELLTAVLESKDDRARAAATRVLSYWRTRIPGSTAMLMKLAADEAPRVRLEAVRAASFFENADEGREIVAVALTKPLDYYLNYTITETNATLDRRGGSRSGANEALMTRLASGEIQGDQLVAITQLVTRDANASQLAAVTNAILAGKYSAADQAAALQPVMLAAKASKIQPAIDTDLASRQFVTALQAGQWELTTAMAQMSGQWDIEEMTEPLREAIFGKDTADETLEAALVSVLGFGTPRASDTRGELGRNQTSSRLKLHYAKAVAANNTALATGAVGYALSQGIDASESELLGAAVQAILAQKNGVAVLTKQLQTSPPRPDAAKIMLRAVYTTGTSSGPLVDRLSEVAGIGGPTQVLTAQQRQDLIKQIETRGSAQRGEWVYRRKELNCVQCHALTGAGGNVGPDLSGVGVNSPTEYLLDSILEPSKQIKEAYLTLNVLTTDGTVVRGVKIDRDDTRLVLRDEKGKEIVIAEEDIEAESEGKSLMPEGLHQLLTQEELIDLVAFLSALGKPGDYVVNTRPTIQRYQVLADEKESARLAKLPEGGLESELAKLDDSAWQTVYASVNGDLPSTLLPARALIVLRGEVDVVVPGPVGLRATSQTDVQLVIGGKSVASNGEQMVELPQGRHAIYLVIESPQQLKSLVAEFTKPVGAATQFSVVGGL
ncbi:MAG: PVC-type heme-binding CxxCH protein [Planctomycetaceae bacterium]